MIAWVLETNRDLFIYSSLERAACNFKAEPRDGPRVDEIEAAGRELKTRDSRR